MGNSLDALASYFRPQVDEFLAKCSDAGIPLIIVDTDRTVSEQAVKLAIGVSWTQNSKHLPQPPEQKSEAIDVVPTPYMTMKLWNPVGEMWAQIGEIGESCGMFWGGRWQSHPDPGHFQYVNPNQS
jgi:hypothetical protein